ncbi:MAG: nicotinate (nicotinamide) nucleotide adenylyltransferase [Bacteroidia bacterium]
MKIGLFFGSFNPVHVGHLVLANYMLSFTDLEEVWFIVSPQNPLKKKKTLLDERHRLQLVRLAIDDHPKLKANDIEFKISRPSYTTNTLAHLKEKYPHVNFTLILGADNLENFHKWKNYEEILNHHELYIYPRINNNASSTSEALLLEKHPKVKMVDAPLLEISSTFIRNAIKDKKDVRYFMPLAVWNYVKEMHFYQ